MSDNGKLPASAWVEFDCSDGHYEGRYPIWQQHQGLTKREVAAIAAMKGVLAGGRYNDAADVAERAVEQADALLAALDPTP